MTQTLGITIATEWTDVAAEMTNFFALGLVAVGLAVIIGMRVAPKVVRAIRSAFRG